MADRPVVINELLCFLANKYGNKYNDKNLKMILTNFYPQEEILKAKETLLKDIELINPDKWTKPGHRRDSDLSQRASKEVGDIISSWRLLDENGLIDKLPKYVALDLTNTPPVRMEEGEFNPFNVNPEYTRHHMHVVIWSLFLK